MVLTIIDNYKTCFQFLPSKKNKTSFFFGSSAQQGGGVIFRFQLHFPRSSKELDSLLTQSARREVGQEGPVDGRLLFLNVLLIGYDGICDINDVINLGKIIYKYTL